MPSPMPWDTFGEIPACEETLSGAQEEQAQAYDSNCCCQGPWQGESSATTPGAPPPDLVWVTGRLSSLPSTTPPGHLLPFRLSMRALLSQASACEALPRPGREMPAHAGHQLTPRRDSRSWMLRSTASHPVPVRPPAKSWCLSCPHLRPGSIYPGQAGVDWLPLPTPRDILRST